MLTVFSQMPNYCTVCGLSKAKDPSLSLYRIPKEPELRRIWLESLSLTDDKICAESRVCSRHFRDGNPKNIPSLHIGKSFSDRPTDETVRGKRRASRELLKHKRQSEPPPKRPCVHSHSPRSSTPTSAISASFSLPSPTPLSNVQYNGEPFRHANVQYDAEPFWHANVQYNAEPFWHANVQYNAEPFRHANVQYNSEPFWHANMYSTMGSHSGTLMYSMMLSHSGTLMYSMMLSHSGTLMYSIIGSHSGTLDQSGRTTPCATMLLRLYCVLRVALALALLASSRIFLHAHARYGGGRGKGRKNTSGDYCTVFVSPAGICGGPMKLHQPCDIAERYVTCTQQGQR